MFNYEGTFTCNTNNGCIKIKLKSVCGQKGQVSESCLSSFWMTVYIHYKENFPIVLYNIDYNVIISHLIYMYDFEYNENYTY